MPKKIDIHREWFRTVMPGRKSCPGCKAKLAEGESVWQWGNYIRAKWRNVLSDPFCVNCYPTRVVKPMIDHAKTCGCTFELVGYQGAKLPHWLNLPDQTCKKSA